MHQKCPIPHNNNHHIIHILFTPMPPYIMLSSPTLATIYVQLNQCASVSHVCVYVIYPECVCIIWKKMHSPGVSTENKTPIAPHWCLTQFQYHLSHLDDQFPSNPNLSNCTHHPSPMNPISVELPGICAQQLAERMMKNSRVKLSKSRSAVFDVYIIFTIVRVPPLLSGKLFINVN